MSFEQHYLDYIVGKTVERVVEGNAHGVVIFFTDGTAARITPYNPPSPPRPSPLTTFHILKSDGEVVQTTETRKAAASKRNPTCLNCGRSKPTHFKLHGSDYPEGPLYCLGYEGTTFRTTEWIGPFRNGRVI
jgi:hypothetical protein